MGRQINFLMNEKTQKELLSFVVESGGEIWCNGWNNNRTWDNPYQVNAEQGLEKLNEYGKVWLYKKEFGEIKFDKIEGLGQSIHGLFQPMIEFCKTYVDPNEKRISRGRLWVELKYWNDEEELVEKPKEVYIWFQALSRWVRKRLIVIETGKHVRTGYIYKELISEEFRLLIEKEGYKIF